MNELPTPTSWRKSTYSGGNGGQCVEIANTLTEIRNSKNPGGPTLRANVPTFVQAVKKL
jgi:hypothetical protein